MVPADQFRQDLLEAGHGNGKHGFTSTLPASVKDGRTYPIRVNITGSNFTLEPLASTPQSVTCGS